MDWTDCDVVDEYPEKWGSPVIKGTRIEPDTVVQDWEFGSSVGSRDGFVDSQMAPQNTTIATVPLPTVPYGKRPPALSFNFFLLAALRCLSIPKGPLCYTSCSRDSSAFR